MAWLLRRSFGLYGNDIDITSFLIFCQGRHRQEEYVLSKDTQTQLMFNKSRESSAETGKRVFSP